MTGRQGGREGGWNIGRDYGKLGDRDDGRSNGSNGNRDSDKAGWQGLVICRVTGGSDRDDTIQDERQRGQRTGRTIATVCRQVWRQG